MCVNKNYKITVDYVKLDGCLSIHICQLSGIIHFCRFPQRELLHYVQESCLAGGEESTIKFMEGQSLVTSCLPLVDEAYAYGIVQHPFPLKYILSDWKLGSDFYQAVKIGIVQYVCSFSKLII